MTGADVTGQTFSVLKDVARERQSQDHKWGPQGHDPEMLLAILTEEVGEVAKEIAESRVNPALDASAYREELIQVAAVAICAVETLDYGAAGRGRP
jgi:NTP pyrophosphatase (non-canonical NTP hydrolase)